MRFAHPERSGRKQMSRSIDAPDSEGSGQRDWLKVTPVGSGHSEYVDFEDMQDLVSRKNV